jgi:hypothetical protein
MKRSSLLLLLLLAAGCTGSGTLGNDDDTSADDDDSTPPLDCDHLLVPALPWFEEAQSGDLEGTIEFAQTHVVGADDSRIAPLLIQEREALVLFTPSATLAPDLDLRIAAFDDGELLGVLGLAPPQQLPPSLEQSITSEPLDPYSELAWSAALPWHWLREDVELRIAHVDGDGLSLFSLPLTGLAAPHTFTLSRSKIVLFGEPDFDTTTVAAGKLAQDFFAALPFAELRFVDSAPWRLDELVVTTSEGPRLVSSEDERLAITDAPDRWSILKHQFALRTSLANTGRGLVQTVPSDGDNSPYSFGTSVVMGWVRGADGNYADINNSPYAAGWTGWSALWQGECANVFPHELGHSMTLEHFTDGTAEGWGIDDEYPQDGTNLATHPWGFDTTRREFRTWYRVDGAGPVLEDGALVGKRDPMNGGEAANGVTCFPQYTAYHAWKAQTWAQSAPNLAQIEGQVGAWRWDPSVARYQLELVAPSDQEPTAVAVPVLTVTGTLGNDDTACQSYPPIHWPSGNVFQLPDPLSDSLPAEYDGARWFLEISYADGTVERALIARGAMDSTTVLALYSLNLEATREPTTVDLYHADAAYPDLDPAAAELVHSRSLGGPAEPLPPVVRVGRGFVANGSLRLTGRCSPGVDCSGRMAESTWRVAQPPLFLSDSAGTSPEAVECLDEGTVVSLDVAAVSDVGQSETLVLHAQRVMSNSDGSRAVAMNDVTPWFAAPDTQQSLRLWLPFAENGQLPAGHYRSEADLSILGTLAADAFSTTTVSVELTVHETTAVDLADEYTSPGVTLADSSVYYLVEDPAMGPTDRIWWGGDGPTVLRVPVLDEASGELVTLHIDSWKEACGTRWDLNAGQAADWGCAHSVVLAVAETGNDALLSGHSYRSAGSSPLVTTAHRWHAPNARELLETFAFEIVYTAP